MITTYALYISAGTRPMITLMTGGVSLDESAFGYFLFDVNSNEPDVSFNHRIISLEEYRNTGGRKASRFDVNHWTN